jgi:Ran GTPase-activating protein (RanGAP) involved in mRNA processing and transport
MMGVAIGVAGAKSISAALAGNKSVKRLVLPENAVSDAGAVALAASLSGSRIEELHLPRCGIGSAGAEAIGRALQGTSALRLVQLAGNRAIGDKGAAGIAQGLAKVVASSKRRTLRLNLIDCGIGADGASALGRALASQSFASSRTLIVDLNLERNVGIGDAGALALADALRLRVDALRLGGSGVGESGATAIAEALGRRPNSGPASILSALDLSRNPKVGDTGASAVAAAAALAGTKDLNLSSCGFGDAASVALAEALGTGRIGRLVAAANALSDAAAERLADALERLNRAGRIGAVELLDLRYNRVGDAGAQALARVLEARQAVAGPEAQATFFSRPPEGSKSLLEPDNAFKREGWSEGASTAIPFRTPTVLLQGNAGVARATLARFDAIARAERKRMAAVRKRAREEWAAKAKEARERPSRTREL